MPTEGNEWCLGVSGVWGSLESQEGVKSNGYALGIPSRRSDKEALPGLCVLSTVGNLLCLQKQLLPSLGSGLRGGFFNPLGCSGAGGGSEESGLGPQGPAVTTNTHSSLSRLSPLQSIQSPMACWS